MGVDLGANLAVDSPEIDEVLDLETGQVQLARKIIGSDYAAAIALRMRLQESIARGQPTHVCPVCGVPVYLVSRREQRRFFFRHLLEDGRCSLVTRGKLSREEINARKYNGLKESAPHIQMKEWVAESLACDPDFAAIKKESVWKGRDRGEWRKPDVRALYRGIPIAFEIQLSTTYLSVIAERRVFYQKQDALLCWIFRVFDPEHSRLAYDDIGYSNNLNVFVVNQQTLNASRTAGRFLAECLWAEPYRDDGELRQRWMSRVVSFKDLTLDGNQQRIYLFDYEGACEDLKRREGYENLRREFDDYWLSNSTYGRYDAWAWSKLRKTYRQIGIVLPANPHSTAGPVALLNALYSAREGIPVGWKFDRLVQVAHRIADSYPYALRDFRKALTVYDRGEQLKNEDKTHKWRDKVKGYLAHLEGDDPKYRRKSIYDKLLKFLFPEVY